MPVPERGLAGFRAHGGRAKVRVGPVVGSEHLLETVDERRLVDARRRPESEFAQPCASVLERAFSGDQGADDVVGNGWVARLWPEANPCPRLSSLDNSGSARPCAAYAPTMAPADVPAMTVLALATKPASISRAASTPISHAIPTSPPLPESAQPARHFSLVRAPSPHPSAAVTRAAWIGKRASDPVWPSL